ncbi:hypothetical protein KSP39_PZI020320 [Platanthera zijinensis]|uniref:Uncharacterized protein n=1 Tax=Platanthera zijinensis TaxID=2320716 RepID=A0AAP0FWK1_9ASPA
MRLRSSLTDNQVTIWRRRFGLPTDFDVKIPRVEERVQNPPHGWLTISEATLRSGFRFPPCEEVIEILKFCGVPISQFTPLGVVRIMGLVILFHEHDGKLSLDCFRDWCDIRFDGGERVEIHCNIVGLILRLKRTAVTEILYLAMSRMLGACQSCGMHCLIVVGAKRGKSGSFPQC